ncbi:cytidylyltransferase domain-containing protein [Streptomyces milbemycinicus]|nr:MULTISPECIES: hypothetical protein [Streptomyces]
MAVVPCRYGSTRFPGKALAPVNGMPLLRHVHQRCLMAENIDGTLIATDDVRITRSLLAARHPSPDDRCPPDWYGSSGGMCRTIACRCLCQRSGR